AARAISTFDRKETDANKEKIVEKRKKEAFNQVYDDFVSTQLRNMNDKLWDEVTLIEDEEVTTSSFFQIYNDSFGDS
ncbi:MAG: peptidylprolyl isomerase, partial [Lachnospiraceae bacterium]|nr:peptidylprolyl isomerase [Lachnospiraceae bacterium]